VLRAAARVGGLTFGSRVLGFVRDILTAQLLGAGPVADAFFVAFRIPNHFRTVFAEGAFNAAFVPSYAKLRHGDGGAPAARLFAEHVLALLVLSQLVLLVLMLWGMPSLVRVLAPGFVGEPVRFGFAVLFSRITFGYLLCIALVSLLGGVLNAQGRFDAAAFAPTLMNACFIAFLLAAHFFPTPGHAMAWGVLAAGIAQLLLLVFAAQRAGTSLRLRRPRLTPDVRGFFRTLGPAAFGSGIVQLGLFADTLIASFLPAGAISYLYYADRLNQLPMGVVGIAMGTVLLPDLSRRIAARDEHSAARAQARALTVSLAVTLPCAIGLVLLADPLMVGLFMRGAFDRVDAHGSAMALVAYGFGLPAFVLVRSLTPGFQARGDTKTPVKLGLIATAVKLGLKVALIAPFAQVGIAAGTSLGAWLNVILLSSGLSRRGWLRLDADHRALLRRCAWAGTAMIAVLVAVNLGAARWSPRAAMGTLDALAIVVLGGSAGLLAYALAIGAGQWRAIGERFAGALRRR
jgi:putative peptidoglycan lipid II flippase